MLNSRQEQDFDAASSLVGEDAAVVSGASECDGARPASASWSASFTGDLARVVDAWDNLPLHIRTSILALVDAAKARG
jgi:hypothetical protein